jgi:hypothetical protein
MLQSPSFGGVGGGLHSILKLFTGFAIAVFIARCATVIHAILIELIIANKNIEVLNSIR